MTIALQIGLDTINSYKRLAYTPWHAIAEMVDNSTQSYFNNRELLDHARDRTKRPLTVNIDYRLEDDFLRVEDNAMGMSYEELEQALYVAHAPANTSGRSKYGMGLKTSACWIGNLWTVRTKKLGETIEHFVTVDVERIAAGDNSLPYQVRDGLPSDAHYTIVEITRHNRKFKGRTLGKIEQFLSSMYRQDFRNNILNLIWRGKPLDWPELDDRFLIAHDGNPYWKAFDFKIEYAENTKQISGWVAVLRDGSRRNAGFSMLHSGRVVRGWPDSWRPEILYGQEQGSNNLVNQRLVGEINLDEFEVSHTKDDILWLGDQEELVEEGLFEVCKDYKEVANTFRKGTDDLRGPSELEMEIAVSELQRELASPEMSDIVKADPMLSEEIVQQVFRSVKEYVIAQHQEKFNAKIGSLTVKGYIEWDISPNDPYVTIDSAKESEVIVIVNAAHPHWSQLEGNRGVLNYLRHCTYDGIAEWQARTKTARLDPDTIKLIKDKLLWLPMQIERHAGELDQ
jgi:hypothetical protein